MEKTPKYQAGSSAPPCQHGMASEAREEAGPGTDLEMTASVDEYPENVNNSGRRLKAKQELLNDLKRVDDLRALLLSALNKNGREPKFRQYGKPPSEQLLKLMRDVLSRQTSEQLREAKGDLIATIIDSPKNITLPEDVFDSITSSDATRERIECYKVRVSAVQTYLASNIQQAKDVIETYLPSNTPNSTSNQLSEDAPAEPNDLATTPNLSDATPPLSLDVATPLHASANTGEKHTRTSARPSRLSDSFGFNIKPSSIRKHNINRVDGTAPFVDLTEIPHPHNFTKGQMTSHSGTAKQFRKPALMSPSAAPETDVKEVSVMSKLLLMELKTFSIEEESEEPSESDSKSGSNTAKHASAGNNSSANTSTTFEQPQVVTLKRRGSGKLSVRTHPRPSADGKAFSEQSPPTSPVAASPSLPPIFDGIRSPTKASSTSPTSGPLTPPKLPPKPKCTEFSEVFAAEAMQSDYTPAGFLLERVDSAPY